MLFFTKKVHGIPFSTVWYATEKVNIKGVIQYREAFFKPKSNCVAFDTLISDLQEEEDEIIARYSKNCRYEIRRAEKEGVSATVDASKDIAEKDIDEFCDFFVEFWATKGVNYQGIESLKQEITEYVEKNAFCITSASINGRKVVYHTYILTENYARLLHSVSLYRQDETIPHSLIGMANRYLHKEDMLYFKNAGKKKYDWGGAGMTGDVINITKFKQSFGGDSAVYYNFDEVNGLKAKLLMKASVIKQKLRRK